MKKIIFLVFVVSAISFAPAYGHKLITHDDTHMSFEKALEIPDHKISWAIYESLGPYEKKFYSFDGKPGDSFHASIVIPKIAGLEGYSPTLVLINGNYGGQDTDLQESQAVLERSVYEGRFPGQEFYEPFGQVTYWERQEINTTLLMEGEYFVMVFDETGDAGKYSLAIGTIEDFTGTDLITILPTAWLETKLFVGDYSSVAVFVSILIAIPAIPATLFIRKRSKFGL